MSMFIEKITRWMCSAVISTMPHRLFVLQDVKVLNLPYEGKLPAHSQGQRTVSYKMIRTAIFLFWATYSGNYLALDLNSGGKEQSEWGELGRMKKGVIGSISPWPCIYPPKNMNKIRQAVWNCHGAKKWTTNYFRFTWKISAAFRFSRHLCKNWQKA